MALNFTVAYTYSAGTTISSSQANTNESDIANVFTGLEAGTKTLAFLKMDAVPATTLEVATKGYVDRSNGYRRPVLQFGSVTTVAVESGLDGTSGDIPLLFSDGSTRTETSTTRTTFNITRNVVLLTSGAQSGLTGATSEATNTWYALYGAKVTDSSTLWCTVGTTVLPTQANYATLNTAYGTNGWVYLGMGRNGDNSAATGDILSFLQVGNRTIFTNVCTAQTSGALLRGTRLASSAGATSVTYAYSAGTGTTAIPNNLTHVTFHVAQGSVANNKWVAGNSAGTNLSVLLPMNGTAVSVMFDSAASEGVLMGNSGSSVTQDVNLAAFVDNALGVGSNPLL